MKRNYQKIDTIIQRIAWVALLACLAFLLVCSLAACRTAKISDVSSSMESMEVDSCAVAKMDSVGAVVHKSEVNSSVRIDSVKFVAVAFDDDSVTSNISSNKVQPWQLANGHILNTAVAYGIHFDTSSFDWSLKSDSIAKSVSAMNKNHKESAVQQQTKQSEPKDNKAGQIILLCFIIVAFIAIARIFFNADKL